LIASGTIDALLIHLCRRHDLVLLSADHDFAAAAKHVEFELWRSVK
jgi:predicted nucleic acid-binding protein